MLWTQCRHEFDVDVAFEDFFDYYIVLLIWNTSKTMKEQEECLF